MNADSRSPGDKSDLSHVLAPLRVGNVLLRNRVIMPAHTTNYGVEHLPSQQHRAYHRARARGGVGAIIFESIRVHWNSLGRPQAINGYDPRCIEPFRQIVSDVQAEGAKIFGQVIHLGRQIDGDFERTVSWGPSPIPWTATAPPPHEMDADEMEEVIAGHLRTAENLIEAGFDGLELQMGHGHLLQQFLSPLSNQRTDEFGGSVENRLRFPLRVLERMRAAVGPDYCLGIRLSAEEFVDGGLHLDEATQIVRSLAGAVPIDFVNVTHSAYHGSRSLATQMADMAYETDAFRVLPATIRQVLHQAGQPIPVFAVCRFTTLAQADAAIAAGQADAVAMARAHIAEPAIVAKTLAGREAEIRPCIGCNQGCAGMLEKNMPIRCLVNPRTGMEQVWGDPVDHPAAMPRRILVIGGGPAGLECAATAAARGHRVQLWESADRLGGQLLWLERMPHRREFLDLLRFQREALARYGVAVSLGRTATFEDVAAAADDVVVVATGSTPVRPEVVGRGEVLTLEDALADPDRLGPRVAVADTTGEWSTLAFIEHLANHGKEVTVFSPVAAFAWRTTIYSTLGTSSRLRDKAVRLALLRRIRGWDGGRLDVEDVSTGQSEAVDVDSLVFAATPRAEDSLYRELRGQGLAAYRIGDCVAPRTALEAVHHGHELARSL